jgi:glutathione S-transferase
LTTNLPWSAPVPWDSTTQTPAYNPLEKLPVLIADSTSPPISVYESHFILEWLETKYPPPAYAAMLSVTNPDDNLFAKQVEVLCDGMCDALVLLFFERQRREEARSKERMERQMRRVDGGLGALSQWVGRGEGEMKFLVNGEFGLADVAAGSVLGYLKV